MTRVPLVFIQIGCEDGCFKWFSASCFSFVVLGLLKLKLSLAFWKEFKFNLNTYKLTTYIILSICTTGVEDSWWGSEAKLKLEG